MATDRHDEHLANLRAWRNRQAPDQSLAFLKDQFRREVEMPHQQIGRLATLWQDLVPADILDRTALVSFTRGLLTVEVPDSATLYQLTGLLRAGLQEQLRSHSRSALRRVTVRVAGRRDP